MELHAPDRKILVPDAHDFAFVSFSGDFQTVGQGVALDDEGVIARGGKGIGHAFKEVLPVMLYGRSLAVHHAVIDDDLAAEGVANALMSQTNAEERGIAAKSADDFIGEAGFARGTGTGGNENAFGLQFADLVEGNLVVAMDLQIHLHLTEVLDEVIGERIVIVYDQNHGRKLLHGCGFGNWKSKNQASRPAMPAA